MSSVLDLFGAETSSSLELCRDKMLAADCRIQDQTGGLDKE